MGYPDPKGYGRFRPTGEKVITAHRFAWKLWRGLIPDGLCVLHHCDTPSCVNPEHLFLGTVADNTNDMVKKGRNVYFSGEKSPLSKLKESDVIKIRACLKNGETQISIARKFGVVQQNISNIKNGKGWKHIPIDAVSKAANW